MFHYRFSSKICLQNRWSIRSLCATAFLKYLQATKSEHLVDFLFSVCGCGQLTLDKDCVRFTLTWHKAQSELLKNAPTQFQIRCTFYHENESNPGHKIW